MFDNDGVSLGHAVVTGDTEKGIWVEAEEVDEERTFIPYSQIHDDSEVYKYDSPPGELIVTTWFAKKRGWYEE